MYLDNVEIREVLVVVVTERIAYVSKRGRRKSLPFAHLLHQSNGCAAGALRFRPLVGLCTPFLWVYAWHSSNSIVREAPCVYQNGSHHCISVYAYVYGDA